jgi:hypothetical protein
MKCLVNRPYFSSQKYRFPQRIYSIQQLSKIAVNQLSYLYVLFFLGASTSLLGQKFDNEIPDIREVTINYDDSMAIVQVYTLPKKVKVEDNKRYYWYYLNELHCNLGGYQGKLLHGSFILLDSKNNMISKGYIKEGVKDGVWKKWYPNGNIREIRFYDEGIKDGTHVFYNINGSQSRQEKYKKGELQIKEQYQKSKKSESRFSTFRFLKSGKKNSALVKNNKKCRNDIDNDTLLIKKSNIKDSEDTVTKEKIQSRNLKLLELLKQKIKRKSKTTEASKQEDEIVLEKEKTPKKKVLQINAGKMSTSKNDRKAK